MRKVRCECGAVYPPFSREVHGSRINGIANGCIRCKPAGYYRRIGNETARRYLRRYGGYADGKLIKNRYGKIVASTFVEVQNA